MYRTILGLSLLATSAMAFAEGANGVWRTEANDSGYQNLGKPIIHDMKPHGENEYAGGTFWDPEKDKTYKSKMTVKGDDLDVEGCISFVCVGEDWKRVK